MKNRPLASLALLALAVLVTFVAPIFDSSLFGVKGHPTEWLSFLPNAPFRLGGLTLFFSPFIHLNPEHLFTNLVMLVPISLMIERKRSAAFLIACFFIIHCQVLLYLWAISFFDAWEGKAFLGMSHVIVGLFSFWSLTNKKAGLFILALLVLGLGQWQAPNTLTFLAHFLGILTGIELFFLSSLYHRTRTKSAN